jgi:hypothetical protein
MVASYPDRLIEIVSAHGGLDRPQARAAIEDTLAAIGAVVHGEDRDALRGALPEELAPALDTRREAPVELASPRGRERVAAACLGLATTLPAPVVERLRRGVPELAEWLVSPAPAAAAPPRRPGPRATLAAGRPGSDHPVSEGTADRAQSESVARSDDPHGASKLSGGRPR